MVSPSVSQRIKIGRVWVSPTLASYHSTLSRCGRCLGALSRWRPQLPVRRNLTISDDAIYCARVEWDAFIVLLR
jgi:hypothetical protein